MRGKITLPLNAIKRHLVQLIKTKKTTRAESSHSTSVSRGSINPSGWDKAHVILLREQYISRPLISWFRPKEGGQK